MLLRNCLHSIRIALCLLTSASPCIFKTTQASGLVVQSERFPTFQISFPILETSRVFF